MLPGARTEQNDLRVQRQQLLQMARLQFGK